MRGGLVAMMAVAVIGAPAFEFRHGWADRTYVTGFRGNVGFRDIDLSHTDRDGADLRGHSLVRVRMVGTRLRDADLTAVTLDGADLQEAMLDRAVLLRARARGASFRRASLVDTDLRDADLRNADFTGANLRGADLRGARAPGFVLAPPEGATDPWTMLLDGDLAAIVLDAGSAHAQTLRVLRPLAPDARR